MSFITEQSSELTTLTKFRSDKIDQQLNGLKVLQSELGLNKQKLKIWRLLVNEGDLITKIRSLRSTMNDRIELQDLHSP
jgi:hypothetical protein